MTANLIAAREAFRAGDYDAALAEGLALLADTETAEPVEVWLLLAAIWQAQGLLLESEVAYRKAVQLLPDRADIRLSLAAVLRRNGQLEEAEAVYRQSVARSPRNIPASLSLMEFLSEAGRHQEAISTGETLLASGLEHIDLRQAIGNAYFASGQFADALAAYQSALVFSPNHIALLYNAALSALQSRKNDQAVGFLERLLSLQPEHVFAWLKLAGVLAEQGDDEKAIDACQKAIDLAPDMIEPQRMLADALCRVGRLDMAQNVFAQLLASGSAGRQDYLAAVQALQTQRRPALALAQARIGLQKFPDDVALLALQCVLRRTLCEHEGLVDEIAALAHALGHSQQSVGLDWEAFAGLAWPGDTWLSLAQHWAGLTLGTEAVKGGAWSVPEKTLLASGQSWARHGLKVGYLVDALVSDPPSLETLQGLLARHDTARCQPSLFLLDAMPGFDTAATRLASTRKAQSLNVLQGAELDVLIVVGRVRAVVYEWLAARPAPLQCVWQSHPGSLGLQSVDYVLTDKLALPPAEQAYFTEAPVWMPTTATYVDQAIEAAQIVPIRPVCGLPAQGFVFAAHCPAHAIDPESLSCWLKILKQLPGSVLWLQVADETAQGNLRLQAAYAGVDATRLVFAPTLALPDQLARLRHADLYLVPLLDTRQSGAEWALWAGVPVLACTGDNLFQRPAASVLRAAGMEDGLVPDAPSYVMQAAALGRDRATLHAMRYRLSEEKHRQPLFDSNAFVRGLESALHTIYLRREEGEQPVPVEIQKDIA